MTIGTATVARTKVRRTGKQRAQPVAQRQASHTLLIPAVPGSGPACGIGVISNVRLQSGVSQLAP